MELQDVILEPMVTEKVTNLSETANQFGFVVNRRANKIDIKRAIEKKFDVKVKSVRTMNVTGKIKTLGRFTGKRSDWKKAIVTLAEGHKIELFEGVLR